MKARAIVQLVLAAAAAVGCVLSWLAAITTVEVPPIIEGEPMTTSSVYSAPLLSLALLLATVAGVLAVLGIARWRRVNRGRVDGTAPVSA
ncbi:hypothetical protein [Mycobacterium sp. 29Ha]|uniref:hypothetical protein n=1 Tax=Mycobacterium sp. 29Ha TaxID=2939268 RepID=UPI0029391224|nr:hypothetical protein [Mycobacterium sp. 29Ha]MDV3133976.1 hypothetical protein [Mycobacterium sp. 29Ha]